MLALISQLGDLIVGSLSMMGINREANKCSIEAGNTDPNGIG
jgi:hypothetical protein